MTWALFLFLFCLFCDRLNHVAQAVLELSILLPHLPPHLPMAQITGVHHRGQLTLTWDEMRNVRVLSRETCGLLY